VATLVALPKQIDAIDFAIDDFGAVKDTASVVFCALCVRERQKLDQHIKDELSRIIQSQSGTKALQEPIYTVRGGRFVLPVMANMRYLLDGIVHDASQSGLTVYVEPISVVELSNQTRIKDSAIESEIERIVVELCDQLRPFADQIADCYSALIDLDCIMARGRLSLLYSGNKPAKQSTYD
jgi:DNA mismatch repair protein MutS2